MIAEELAVVTIEEENINSPKENINSTEENLWLDNLEPDLAKLATNKGWKNYSEAVRSYQHLEKMLGSDRADRTVVLPKDNNDIQAYEDVYKRLGCPENASDYNLTEDFNEGEMDGGFLNKMGEAMHQLGLNNKQAKSLAQAYKEQIAHFQEEIIKQGQTEIETLKNKWGPNYERQVANAKKAATKFKFSNDDLIAIENSFGSKMLLEKLALIGEALAEDVDIEANLGNANFNLKGAGAKNKINELLSDPLFKERYLKGESEALKQIEELSYRVGK